LNRNSYLLNIGADSVLYLPLDSAVRWSMAIPAESFLADPKGEHAYLAGITLRACQIAKAAAANATEAVGTNVPDLYQAVENCEKELDQVDRELDQRICAALENASALQRREMLARMPANAVPSFPALTPTCTGGSMIQLRPSGRMNKSWPSSAGCAIRSPAGCANLFRRSE